MKTLLDDIRNALGALAYSELGEMQSFEQKLKVVNAMPPATRLQQSVAARRPVERRKRVVLAVHDRVVGGAVKYAVNTCQRMDADLDILCTSSRTVIDVALRPYANLFNNSNIQPRIEICTLPMQQALADFTRAHNDTLLVVAGSGDEIQNEMRQNKRSKTNRWQLDFPLVVVMDNN